jgi:hypothetical protein
MQTSAVRVHWNIADSKLYKEEFEDWKTDGGKEEVELRGRWRQ